MATKDQERVPTEVPTPLGPLVCSMGVTARLTCDLCGRDWHLWGGGFRLPTGEQVCPTCWHVGRGAQH